MRLLAALLLLPTLAAAQPITQWPGGVTPPIMGIASGTNGAAITGVPASTCAAPGIYLTTATTTGLAFTATPSVILCVNGSAILTGTSTAVTSTVPIQAGDATFSGTVTPTGRLMLPMGQVGYFNTTGTGVTISGTSDGTTNMVAVNPETTFTNDHEFDNGGANDGTLRYTGTVTKTFHVAITLSGTPATANDLFVFGLSKNGGASACKVLGSASGTQFSALHCMVSLATNDKIQAYVGNTSGSRNITIKSLNVFAMGM